MQSFIKEQGREKAKYLMNLLQLHSVCSCLSVPPAPLLPSDFDYN